MKPRKLIRRSRRPRKQSLKYRKVLALLDTEARLRVFDRDNWTCIRCNDGSRGVQWAHVFSRRHVNLRWESDNSMTLCGGCHLWWHHEPVLAIEWFRKNYPERYDRIRAVHQANPKVYPRQLLAELKAGQ